MKKCAIISLVPLQGGENTMADIVSSIANVLLAIRQRTVPLVARGGFPIFTYSDIIGARRIKNGTLYVPDSLLHDAVAMLMSEPTLYNWAKQTAENEGVTSLEQKVYVLLRNQYLSIH